MSSAEDDRVDSPFDRPRKPRDSKKRRVARACDICRRRKGVYATFTLLHCTSSYAPCSSVYVLFCFPSKSVTQTEVPGDGEQGPGRKCANCATAGLECSYVQAMKVRALVIILGVDAHNTFLEIPGRVRGHIS